MGAAASLIEASSRSRLPPLDGDISLECLDKPGSIVYDKWGTPHIYASSRKDGYRLQGFVTAQHRGFQLTLNYLITHGKLASVIGVEGKSADIFSRTLNFKGLGRKDWEYLLDDKDKYKSAIEMVSCYVQGINAWFSHPSFRKPVELSTLLLNYDPPFWSETDVMAAARVLGIRLSPGLTSKILSTLLIQLVGYENAEWFCFDSNKIYQCPYEDLPNKVGDFYLGLKNIGQLLEKENQPIMGLHRSYFNNTSAYIAHASATGQETDVLDIEDGGASNAFVVSGDHTANGKPILCNDPHLNVAIPITFCCYHVTVECDEDEDECMHWSGVQAVGLPSICIGHNEYISMGITVGACDVTDVFVERFKDETSNLYRVDDEWKECRTRQEVIEIKGMQDYVLIVRETHHGPVLQATDFDKGIEKGPYSHMMDIKNKDDDEHSKYYLRYSYCAPFLLPRDELQNTPVEILPNIMDSTNVKEAAAHLRNMSFPNFNFVLADIYGNYCVTTNGLIPIRNAIKTYNPMLPQPGWLSKYDWKGFIPHDALPINMNPKCGFIVSCNNNMVDPQHYPYYLGFRFSMGFRARRASQLIETAINDKKKKKITMDYLQSVQCDVHDLSAKEMITSLMQKCNLLDIIATHHIILPKWTQATIDYVVPNEIRNGSVIDVNYYNDSRNREKAQYAWNVLSEWDYNYDIESLGATIYDTFIIIFFKRIVFAGIYCKFMERNKGEKDGESILKQVDAICDNVLRNVYNRIFMGLSSFLYKRIGPILAMIDDDEKECWWIHENYGSRENLIVMTLIDSIDCIQFWSKNTDRSQWKWGTLHELEVFHPLSGKLGRAPFNSACYPMSGSLYTLNMCRANCVSLVKNPLKCIRSSGVICRVVMDCNDWNQSKCILTMGVSGQVASPFYQNQLKKMVDNEYIPMLWDQDNVRMHQQSELICTPSKDKQPETYLTLCHIL